MKVKKCPKCGSTQIGDRWVSGRKLQQYCSISHEDWDEICGWKGEPRTPERRRITDTKNLRLDNFSGWDYIVYDKFGHEMTLSRTYRSESAAKTELERELKQGEKDANAGPYTGVLFNTPTTIKLKGKMFRSKNGVCKRLN